MLENLNFYEAAANGRIEEVSALLAAAPDVGALLRSTQDVLREYFWGAELDIAETPLMVALHNCHEDVVHLLLDAGQAVGLNAEAQSSSTAMPIFACVVSSGLSTVALRLLETGRYDVDYIEDSVTPLILAVIKNREAMVSTLLTAGAQVNIDCGGQTALLWAVRLGHLGVVRIVLQAGADEHYKDSGGNTVLMLASYCDTITVVDRVIIIRLLLDAGVDVNSQNECELTALMHAARLPQDGAEPVRELIAGGADVFMRGYTGQGENRTLVTALDVAQIDNTREFLRREMERRTAAALSVMRAVPEGARREILRISQWR